MPVFQIDIEKQFGTEFWTNVWHVRAPSIGDAVPAANEIKDYERGIHKSYVTFTKGRVRTAVKGDDVYSTLVYNQPGLVANTDSYLPLFNIVRVDLQAEQERPSRKYFRLPLAENDQANSLLAGSVTSSVNAGMAGLIAALQGLGTPLVDVDDQLIISATTALSVGMHQLRRGSKRRQQPILPG